MLGFLIMHDITPAQYREYSFDLFNIHHTKKNHPGGGMKLQRK